MEGVRYPPAVNLPGAPERLLFISHRQASLGSFLPSAPNPTAPNQWILRSVTNVGIKRKPLLRSALCSSSKYLSTYYVPDLL